MSIRNKKANQATLRSYQTKIKSPIWEAYSNAFEGMFKDLQNNNRLDLSPLSHERSNNGFERNFSWDWYVPHTEATISLRKGHSSHHEDDLKRWTNSEESFFDILFEKNTRLVDVIGYTGLGKSTFLHYFFLKYLPDKVDSESGVEENSIVDLNKLAVVNIPLIFTSVEAIMGEWNSEVNNFLWTRFSELSTKVFWKSLLRSNLYLHHDFEFEVVNDELKVRPPTDPNLVDYYQDSEELVNSIDNRRNTKNSFKKWYRDLSTWRSTEYDIGYDMNLQIIRMLSKYFGYTFLLIIDNIDQVHKMQQDRILEIIQLKMRLYQDYKNVKLIIAVRDSFYEPVLSNTYVASYGRNRKPFHLPAMNLRIVLEIRKERLFDPLKGNCSRMSIVNNTEVEVSNVDNFLEALFMFFDDAADNYHELYQLANYNIRRMLKIVQYYIESPHMSLPLIHDISRLSMTCPPNRTETKQIVHKLLSFERLVDVLIRHSNYLVDIKSDSLMPNLFNSGSAEHFSSTLTRLFTIWIVNRESSVSVDEVIANLESFGHGKAAIEREINKLLEMQLIFSNMGNDIANNPKRRNQMLETRDLPCGRYIINHVIGSLYYIQRYAYITPMRSDLLEDVYLPESSSEKIDFKKRMMGASALYKQLESDFINQYEFVAGYQKENPQCRVLNKFNYYGFFQIIKQIHSQIEFTCADLQLLFKEDKLDSAQLFPNHRISNFP
ncbi:MAG: hypothetical protein K8R90_07945 [Candidatus Cloacimonetes bacterium]|nr:hypothetical protein [Candidatus Cloacimonadota bacterium]